MGVRFEIITVLRTDSRTPSTKTYEDSVIEDGSRDGFEFFEVSSITMGCLNSIRMNQLQLKHDLLIHESG